MKPTMDALELDRHERVRSTPPAEKLRQACEMMEFGIAVMRKNLERQHEGATEAEIGELLTRWMLRSS